MENMKVQTVLTALYALTSAIHIEAGINPPNCGRQASRRQSRIINGQQASAGEFPWTIAVGWKHTKDHQTGTIISDRWILMAAHSVASPTWTSPPESMNITAGTADLTKPGGRQYFISRVVPHPRYIEGSKTNSNYDMTLIQTTEVIEFNSNVNAVCLPKVREGFSGRMGQISGFGLNEFNNADTLRKISCSINYERNAATFSCKSGIGMGVAGGDSGSPLMTKNNKGTFLQVGVCTRGSARKNSNGFTLGPLVSRPENLDWIQSVVG